MTKETTILKIENNSSGAVGALIFVVVGSTCLFIFVLAPCICTPSRSPYT